jgi:hypothetical protein
MMTLPARSRFSLIASAGVLLLITCGGLAVPQDLATLENGRVRLTFNQRTGLFDVTPVSGGVLRLVGAGPTFQSDGRTV